MDHHSIYYSIYLWKNTINGQSYVFKISNEDKVGFMPKKTNIKNKWILKNYEETFEVNGISLLD